ncbi:MAG TPA: ATP-binding protein [Kofleriaceae bacterium]|nr:ATP-binding protein [Kofleriaceae bacterium]
MRFPGTLSARIIIGFAVLIVTFGGISLSAVLTTDQLNDSIRVIRVGYLQLALETRDLADKQRGLLSYLEDDLAGETTQRRVETQVRRRLASRQRLLDQLDDTLAALDDVELVHAKSMARTAREVGELRALVTEAEPLYTTLLRAPPIERVTEKPGAVGVDQAAIDAASSALRKLLRHERMVNNRSQSLQTTQRNTVQDTARQLERGAVKMRFLTILWGAIALLVGVLITVWATVNLRPLGRLRDAAREIARGDYGQRIDEKGPREVADLAREFNTMGSAIQERERELVHRERLAAIGKMAAMITHEVRNPLSSIGLNTELLEEELATHEGGAATEEARALCRAIQGEVDRLTDITEEYLHFARLPKPKLQEEAIGAIVKSLTDFEREPMSLRGVTLEVALADDLPSVRADDAQVRQALLNLMRNAADAVADIGGTVKVATRRGEDGMVEISVEDDGPGIVEEMAGKIFEPFFSTKEGGTGLGLALTHQIVRDHGGTIRVASQPGHGARFVVSLPPAGATA